MCLVDDKPELKYINRYVRPQLTAACDSNPQAWKDLGIELMPDSEAALSTISANDSNLVGRCSSLFSLWFQRQPEASWRQLIDALKITGLNNLAKQIKGQLIPSVDPAYTTRTAESQGILHSTCTVVLLIIIMIGNNTTLCAITVPESCECR